MKGRVQKSRSNLDALLNRTLDSRLRGNDIGKERLPRHPRDASQ
jgi:hypothetical protein